jgi:hypothetical protein
MPTPQLDKEVEKRFDDKFLVAKETETHYYNPWLMDFKNHLATELEAQKQVFVEMIEGMTGIQNNPDFFIELQEQLKYNAFAQGVPDVALTQIIWEAKDKTLSDLLKRIKGA